MHFNWRLTSCLMCASIQDFIVILPAKGRRESQANTLVWNLGTCLCVCYVVCECYNYACVCACVCTCICVCCMVCELIMHVCVHVDACVCTCTLYMCVACMCTCTCVYMYMYVCVHVCVHVCVCVCVCTCMYVCVSLFLISSYDPPLAQRASCSAQHSSLFGPDDAVNYSYIVTNSNNCLLIVNRVPMVHTITIAEPIWPMLLKTYQKLWCACVCVCVVISVTIVRCSCI